MRASEADKIMVPRALRFIFWERFDMPWRSWAGLARTLPEAVRRNRFLALDLVFNLGMPGYLSARDAGRDSSFSKAGL